MIGAIIGARRQSIGARHRGKKIGAIIGARRQSIGARHRGKKKLTIKKLTMMSGMATKRLVFG